MMFSTVLKLLIVAGPLAAVASDCDRSMFTPYHNEQSENDDDIRVANALKSYQISRTPKVWRLSYKGEADGLIRVKVPPLQYEPFRVERWQHGARKFLFMNIGGKRIENMIDEANDLVYQKLLETQRKHLLFEFDQKFATELAKAEKLWATIHPQVLNYYLQRKEYVDEARLFASRVHNFDYEHNELFVLFEELPDRLALAMTLQIVYPGFRNYREPTLHGMRLAHDTDFDEHINPLPFIDYVDASKKDEVLARLKNNFNPLTTGETNRHAGFGLRLPDAVRLKVIVEAVDTSIENGLETNLAMCDALTMRRFKRYGYAEFGELPTQVQTDEYLCHLDLHSDSTTDRFRIFRQLLSAVHVESLEGLP